MKSLLSLTLSASLLVSCGAAAESVPAPPLGSRVTVQIRRDALGASSGTPVSITTDAHNGAQVSISGELRHFGDRWLLLEQSARSYWIPREVILLVSASG